MATGKAFDLHALPASFDPHCLTGNV
jgi:hypothetical protein